MGFHAFCKLFSCGLRSNDLQDPCAWFALGLYLFCTGFSCASLIVANGVRRVRVWLAIGSRMLGFIYVVRMAHECYTAAGHMHGARGQFAHTTRGSVACPTTVVTLHVAELASTLAGRMHSGRADPRSTFFQRGGTGKGGDTSGPEPPKI